MARQGKAFGPRARERDRGVPGAFSPSIEKVQAMHNLQAVPAIDLSGDLSFEQWLEIGAELGRAEDRLQWAIGD